jgi:hypothetical protein
MAIITQRHGFLFKAKILTIITNKRMAKHGKPALKNKSFSMPCIYLSSESHTNNERKKIGTRLKIPDISVRTFFKIQSS